MTKMSLPETQAKIVLIIDDTPANVAVLAEYLERQNFEVLVAQDGEEGLERARLAQPGLILLDVMMPGIDGFETCRRLKGMENTQNIPVIFMTALTSGGDRVAGFQAGGVDFITKPIQVDEVLARVNAHLNMHIIQRQLVAKNTRLEQEISERQSAEQTLRIKHLAIEASMNAIFLVNNDKTEMAIEYVNPAFERLTGFTATEVMGNNFTFLLDGAQDQPGSELFHEAIRFGKEAHATLGICRKDGSLFWNDFHLVPVRNDSDHVTHYVGIMNDVTEAKSYEEQLKHQATFDALTGLANRHLLHDRLHQVIVNAPRCNGGVAVLFIDLDNFKVINDSLGHNVGDELLKVVAARMRSSVPTNDTVARLGGDEFVLLLLNQTGSEPTASQVHREFKATGLESDITALVQKLLANIAEPLMLAGREITPSCSIGISIYPQDGKDADTLLKNADAAMYRARERGRNGFHFFTSDVEERIRKRVELESSLRLALEQNEFELHYQPQLSLRSGKVAGVEALLRWRHPQKGLILPGQFIEFAEETGLIVPIGEWVLMRACAQNKAWQDAGLPSVPIAVNISVKQCAQSNIEEVVKKALQSAGLSPKYLELELTETLSMTNPEKSIPLMERLKAIGVELSIDDFGTGYSNMSYLKRFPVDRLKLDISFVREITTEPSSLAISEAIITMSHSLHLQVVAEGVETEGQLALLKTRNCDLMQGYLFSPALQPSELAQLLKG